MAQEAFHVNELDDVNAAGMYMFQGERLEVRGLAKRLPHTARDLVEGRVTPEQVTSSLMLKLENDVAERKRIHWYATVLIATRGIAAGRHESNHSTYVGNASKQCYKGSSWPVVDARVHPIARKLVR